MHKIQTIFELAGKYACLALCYLEIAGIDDEHKFDYLLKGLEKGYLDDDFYVSKPVEFLRMAGLKATDIYKSDYTESEEKLVTEYQWKGLPGSHFVITQNGRIVYNSLDKSFIVENGNPVSVRRIVL